MSVQVGKSKLAGIVTDVSKEHPNNASPSIIVMLAGNVIDVIAVPLNARLPILVRPEGRVIDDREAQL